MNQRKLALSLAVVAAIATPFASGTYKLRPTSEGIIPFSKEAEANLRAVLAETNNCQTNLESVYQIIRPIYLADAFKLCMHYREELQAGGVSGYRFSLSQYLAINAAAAAAAFAAIFGLSYLLPALAGLGAALGRRYWRWLNT